MALFQDPKIPSLSIIIPTLNEEGFIENLLLDIIKQEGYSEIVIADSGSSDQTQSIVKKIASKYRNKKIKLVAASCKGVSIARNTGVKNSTGKYLVFLDADTRIPKMFFRNILEEMLRRKLDAAAAPLIPNSNNLFDRSLFFIQRQLALMLQYTRKPASAGAGIITTRSLHNKIFGFDLNFKYNEDLNYLEKISKFGRFRMIKSSYVIFSVRRFEQEGRFRLLGKYLLTGLFYLLNVNVFIFKYEFGKFSKGNTNN